MKPTKLLLPCMRGRMGDWIYYVTLMSFEEVARRVRLPEEIDKKYSSEDLKLGDWIQRKLSPSRTDQIVQYILHQEERFFNALILGIYDGEPKWQEVILEGGGTARNIEAEEEMNEYLSKTFGLLTLSGKESIFAIDGQHRAVAIRKAVEKGSKVQGDEQAVIFISHKPTPEGKIRTRRVFSTLNKYAKPVSESEIIALSEDSNSAIITRRFVDTNSFLKEKVLVIKNRAIHRSNTSHLTNIMVLHDLVSILSTNKSVAGNAVQGYDHASFIAQRLSDDDINKQFRKVESELKEVFEAIPSVKRFLTKGTVDRASAKTSLIFRPIGQNVIFSAYKFLKEHRKGQALLDYLKEDDFNLANPTWKKLFWDETTNEIDTKKSKQKAAILYLVDSLGVKPRRTAKDESDLKGLGLLQD